MRAFTIYAWTILALFGVLISLYAFWDASKDVAYAKRWTHKETRYLVALSHMRRELVRTIIQTMYLILGSIYVFNDGQPTSFTRLVASAVLVLGSFLIVVNTGLDVLSRRRINVAIERSAKETKDNIETALVDTKDQVKQARAEHAGDEAREDARDVTTAEREDARDASAERRADARDVTAAERADARDVTAGEREDARDETARVRQEEGDSA